MARSRTPRRDIKVEGPLHLRPEGLDPIALAAARFAPRNTDNFSNWAQTKLGNWLTPQQEAINESIVLNRYTAVPSCHAAGKSRYSAMQTGYYIDSHPIGQAFVVTTAPTSAQVESVLWRELIRVHALADLRGRITRAGYPQWHIGDELVAFGRRPTEVASFQGIHERFILIILEEADGIPEPLWIAADTLASSGRARVLAIGNPDSADSYFAKILRPGSGWNVVTCDGLRTPNFTKAAVSKYPELRQYMIDNGIPPSDKSIAHVPHQIRANWRDVLLSPEWVHERMERWGVTRFTDEDGKSRWREPSLWLSKVRGRPPDEGSEGLIPLSWVEAAIRRWHEWVAAGSKPAKGRTVFGVDVADTGKDETVVSTRRGWIIERLDRTGQQDTETTSQRLIGRMAITPYCVSVIDAAGVGVGVVNRVRAAGYPVIAYKGAGSGEGMRDATGEFTFKNRRSAAYWHLRELLDPVNGPRELALPPVDDLITDLTVPKWQVRPGAVIEVEPKDSVVKRLRRSPDCGDCVVMTCWPESSVQSTARIHAYGVDLDDALEEWMPNPMPRDALEARHMRVIELGRKTQLRAGGREVYDYAVASGGLDEW